MSSYFNSELLHYECEKNRLNTEAIELTDDDDSIEAIEPTDDADSASAIPLAHNTGLHPPCDLSDSYHQSPQTDHLDRLTGDDDSIEAIDNDDSTSLIMAIPLAHNIGPRPPCDSSCDRQTHRLLSSRRHCLQSKFYSNACIISPTDNNNSGAQGPY